MAATLRVPVVGEGGGEEGAVVVVAVLTVVVCCDTLWTWLLWWQSGDQLRADEGSRSIAEPLPPGCWREGWWVGEASTLCVVIEAA
jgi:hypothetical protein